VGLTFVITTTQMTVRVTLSTCRFQQPLSPEIELKA